MKPGPNDHAQEEVMRHALRWSLLIIITAGFALGHIALSATGSTCAAPCNAQLSTPFPAQTDPGEYIAVAQDDLPRGFYLADAYLLGLNPKVKLVWWPLQSLPESGNYFTDLQRIANHWIRTDIPRGAPVLVRHLATSEADLASVGSDLALSLEIGEWAVPVRPSVIGNSPDNLALYDVVSVMTVLDAGVESPTTIQIVRDAVIVEFQPDTITLAVADHTAALTLIWAQDNRLPLILVRRTPG
jgi:hypothetical protein